jgi:hypothetical protein
MSALLLFLSEIERKADRIAMLLQREFQSFLAGNGTTRLRAS